MRLVVWNCNMALHRKLEALLRLGPDIAVVPECAAPELLLSRKLALDHPPLWIGRNRHKGLAVLAFNGYRLRLAEPYFPTLHWVAPVEISGPLRFNLLAVWAQNASAGVTRKRQPGPLRRALGKYRGFMAAAPAVVAGDLNSNVIWDRPGRLRNHAALVGILGGLGLESAYHALTGEAPGQETTPTLYWRDRRKDGPTYHIDYVFLPQRWIGTASLSIGDFEPWCGAGLSDHVPVIVDVSPSSLVAAASREKTVPVSPPA